MALLFFLNASTSNMQLTFIVYGHLNNVHCRLGDPFPLNWKTLELHCSDTFQPRVAAVISPSLFYIMNPGQGVYSYCSI